MLQDHSDPGRVLSVDSAGAVQGEYSEQHAGQQYQHLHLPNHTLAECSRCLFLTDTETTTACTYCRVLSA